MLHIQKATGISGSERHLLALLPRLESTDVVVRMCVLVAGDGSRFVDALRRIDVDTVVVPTIADVDPLAVARLAREIRAFAPSLVHTHLIHGDVFGRLAAAFTRTPSVSTVHGTHGFYSRGPYRRVARAAWRSTKRVIAISGWVRTFLLERRLVDDARLRVIPYGIDAGPWRESDGERAQARDELGIASAEVVVGVASRLVPHKGHAFLLDGLRRAAAQAPALRLLVAGDGPLRSSLEAEARRGIPQGVVRFLGYQSNMLRFMSACDALAFPTMPEFGEGFGLAALEAMAAGKPVLATRVGPLPEVVGDETTGILVEPDDPAGLAESLVRLAHDRNLRERLGLAARGRARDQFPVERMVERTRALYHDALD